MIETLKEYPNGGKIQAYNSVDNTSTDYKKIKSCCDYFASQGSITLMTPKLHFKDPLYDLIYSDLIGTKYYRKCPDFKVNNIFYEHEGYITDNPFNAFSNMVSRGIKQSPRIIIDVCGIGNVWAKKYLFDRIQNGDIISEVWILTNHGFLERLY